MLPRKNALKQATFLHILTNKEAPATIPFISFGVIQSEFYLFIFYP